MQKTISGPSKRYAQALFELSTDRQVSLLAALEAFEPHLSEGGALGDTLSSPLVSPEEKKAVLLEVAKNLKADSLLQDFLVLLCEKKRSDLLSDIISCYREMDYAATGTVAAEVFSATELSTSQREDVIAFVKSKMGAKKVELEEQVDASLLAGVKVRTGSVEFDTTVRGQINGLRAALK